MRDYQIMIKMSYMCVSTLEEVDFVVQYTPLQETNSVALPLPFPKDLSISNENKVIRSRTIQAPKPDEI